jgi:hypothetical protein
MKRPNIYELILEGIRKYKGLDDRNLQDYLKNRNCSWGYEVIRVSAHKILNYAQLFSIALNFRS